MLSDLIANSTTRDDKDISQRSDSLSDLLLSQYSTDDKLLALIAMTGDQRLFEELLNSSKFTKSMLNIWVTRFAAKSGNVEILKLAIHRGCIWDSSVLNFAIWGNSYDCIRYLISIGVRPNSESFVWYLLSQGNSSSRILSAKL